MTFRLRAATVPTDYPRLVALFNTASVEPQTVDSLKEADELLPAGGIRHRIIAVEGEGHAIGYAEAYRWPNTRMGKFYLRVVTDPAQRRRGVGSALLEAAQQFTLSNGATRLVGEVQDHDQASLDFLHRRGFVTERHGYLSTLNLVNFDESPNAGIVDGVAAGGIRFFTLADEPGEVTERRLYEMMSQTMPDLPGYEAEGFMSFSTWRSWVVEAAAARAEGVIMAADGDRMVGVSINEWSHGGVYTAHTSVDRAYRGRKIALALKLLAIRMAQQHGVSIMKTGNDSLNGPMLSVNRRLGYVPEAGDYQVAKAL